MALRFLGEADGRLQAALRAIRKLLALGFGEKDICRLIRWCRRERIQSVACTTGRSDAREKEARRCLAQWAIRVLMALGFSEKEIADIVGVDHTTISHLLEPFSDRSVGEWTAQRLKEAVESAGGVRLKLLLPHLRVSILDTCCVKGCRVDEGARGETAVVARSIILNALLGSPVPGSALPDGIDAFLAEIGPQSQPLWVFWDRPDDETEPSAGKSQVEKECLRRRLIHARRREHEAGHLLQRFRERRERIERSLGRHDPPPAGGRIA